MFHPNSSNPVQAKYAWPAEDMDCFLPISCRLRPSSATHLSGPFLPATPTLNATAKPSKGSECTGTSVTLWTKDLHYKSLVLQRPWIRSLLVLHLEICQQSRLWECGNPAGISKECGKGGKPVSWLSMLSILCHFHGLLWKRASHNQNPAEAVLSTGTVPRTASMGALAIWRKTLTLPATRRATALKKR
jgi:hypothetical protein